jgi:hypothetical protein
MDGCSARNNGKNSYSSAPAAGFNAESHYSVGHHAPNIGGNIKNSAFTNNQSSGYLAWDTSETSWVVFENCKFQSDASYATIVLRNQHSFYGCTFYGSQFWKADSGANDWNRIYVERSTFTDGATSEFPSMYTESSLIYGGGQNMRFWSCQFKASKVMAFALSTVDSTKRIFMDYITVLFSGSGASIGSLAGYIYNSNISNLSLSSEAGYGVDSYIYPSNTVIGENVRVLPNSRVSWNLNYGLVSPGTYP